MSTPHEQTAPDLILLDGEITTLDPAVPTANAIAIKGTKIVAVGTRREIESLATPTTRRISLNGRRVIPGLIDSHIHVIRGGLNYNMELRWDGVESVATALRMLREQAQNTPPPQWVRVVGGFTAHQFAERRLPTLAELNEAAPETPVFVLHLYDRALLNRAAVRACGFTKDTPDPPGGMIERDSDGNPTGLLLAKPNALILYSTLARGPKLPREYQINSTQHFMRELNRLGVTGVIDAGGGFQNYPEDYDVVAELASRGELTLRVAYNLFTQKPKGELADFQRWSSQVSPGQGDAYYRHNGAGEMLVFSAADFEDFREPRPDLGASMEAELKEVARFLAEKRWPFRLHATYNETIERALNVFEDVNREIPLSGLHWFFDHAETISERNIDRIQALGGGIAIQHRMAYQGEYFVERYGEVAARRTPPIRRMLEAGVPVGAGTDATRVASYNPWVSLYWLVTGKTVGGLALYPESQLLTREEALRLWTVSNTWFSREEGERGQIKVGSLADVSALSDDFFSVDAERIKHITADLTLVGGKIVHGQGDFLKLAPALPPAMPDWSPVRRFGGYQPHEPVAHHLTQHSCTLHFEPKRVRSSLNEVLSDWSLGCHCWAF